MLVGYTQIINVLGCKKNSEEWEEFEKKYIPEDFDREVKEEDIVFFVGSNDAIGVLPENVFWEIFFK